MGGAFGLLHYLDYRPTHDVDARWSGDATPPQRKRVVEVVSDALAAHGEIREREWGEVVSVELLRERRTVFSFQIAERSAQLKDSVPAGWTDVQLDSLDDVIASKMAALVERGAPRDYRDIYAVCEAEIVSAEACWRLWRMRGERAGGSTSVARAKLAVTTHLKRIEEHRPLDSIADERQRFAAEKTRNWFSGAFLNAAVD